MSIPLALEKLRAETVNYGPTPYLLTQSDDGRPHAVAVSVEWRDDELSVTAGKRSLANVAAHPLVSLLWVPIESGGYSLIVDGAGSVHGSQDAARVTVRPTRGVLHRPGTGSAASPASCGADCVPLLG
jgi:hypothetical protein